MLYSIYPCRIFPTVHFFRIPTYIIPIYPSTLPALLLVFSVVFSFLYPVLPDVFSFYYHYQSTLRCLHPLAIPHHGVCCPFLLVATSSRAFTSDRIVGHPSDDDPVFRPLPLPSRPPVLPLLSIPVCSQIYHAIPHQPPLCHRCFVIPPPYATSRDQH